MASPSNCLAVCVLLKSRHANWCQIIICVAYAVSNYCLLLKKHYDSGFLYTIDLYLLCNINLVTKI